jgi:DNA-binding NtrC family response regulator
MNMNQLQRVLIACSDEQCRQFVTSIFTDWGVGVVAVATIREALEALSARPPSLVFCEDSLSDGSYRDLLSATSSHKPATPVIVLMHSEEIYADSVAAGAFDAMPILCSRSDIQWAAVRAASGAVKSANWGAQHAETEPSAPGAGD